MTTLASRDHAQEIRTVVENWALWRDAGDWERFATVWHTSGQMWATWFQGSATDFITLSRKGFDDGVRILHFLGGTSVDVVGDRAVAQTKMTITQRAEVHGVLADVVCTGRFYDFFALEDGQWRIALRRLIYETDRLTPVDPAVRVQLDPARLARFPEGYRHLAYVQLAAGFDVKAGLPGLTGDAVQALYRDGAAWLAQASGL
ncbi:nuclear transport factor 2 family protein [Kutzneria chonburiensis]|uniref:Nuclear transport factor 2 family protein n=1 Tax=Kutzneria chonburiensis TaxID=1483604 RepID=A0ABV6MMV9_9PSEU|nr:nuclear transport factor 2 family protein [Kutzneria chonburiensis]